MSDEPLRISDATREKLRFVRQEVQADRYFVAINDPDQELWSAPYFWGAAMKSVLADPVFARLRGACLVVAGYDIDGDPWTVEIEAPSVVVTAVCPGLPSL